MGSLNSLFVLADKLSLSLRSRGTKLRKLSTKGVTLRLPRPQTSRAFAFKREVFTDTVEAPCPPVVSSAKGDKTDPVAAQMASYLVCLRSSAVDELLVGDPHRIGRRDVEVPITGRRIVDGGDA